ncbi:MAG: SPFH domain-containing protein [Ruminococcus sp.]|jgi:membrane protease subunit (stomatin/prohibitin family)|nr:SPFH domain-containing protein [Ruminococcus sp.]
MGLIKSLTASVGGGLADQWLEVIKAENMSANTVMVKGTAPAPQRRGLFTPGTSNTKGSIDVISNGSKIQVYPNQMLILLDGGKVVDFTAEEGYYTVDNGSAPSLMTGDLGGAIKDTFNRFRFGGTPTNNQVAYFINLQEIRGIKFGTKTALQYFDSFYNAELFLRCHGIYSFKITDPLKFFYEVCPRDAAKLDFDTEVSEQFMAEFLTALQTSLGEMSVSGIRIAAIPSKSAELSKYMANVLDTDWREMRGMEVQSVGISSISYDDESRKLVEMYTQGQMLSNPMVREGYVQGSVARGLEAAGSNAAGAGMGFMGMGMGMGVGGGFMGGMSNTNMQQMQMQGAPPQQSAGMNPNYNQGGQQVPQGQGQVPQEQGQVPPPPPVPAQREVSWVCSACGQVDNGGRFCENCGKPQQAAMWICSACGQGDNKGKFCKNCGKPNANA